ncbi:hypothetical protein RJ639_010572 [Escallonia herrerae]|uniref:Uncharacterized protein n=1 Tax=Escallonia herrerae TaxID=1293975 RepID=A0AA88VQM2_9ASTE|nr:hypothetical protein RJ639_010572 [Escallonia herrerae]
MWSSYMGAVWKQKSLCSFTSSSRMEPFTSIFITKVKSSPFLGLCACPILSTGSEEGRSLATHFITAMGTSRISCMI